MSGINMTQDCCNKFDLGDDFLNVTMIVVMMIVFIFLIYYERKTITSNTKERKEKH